MKTSAFYFVIMVIVLAGCKTQQTASKMNNDDVYSQKSNTSKPVTEGTMITEDLSAPKNIISDSSVAQKPGSSTLEDDYNDYSARIKRFSHADKDHGYFDDVYSDNGNYDSTSSNPDVNVYIGSGGYSCWDPSFSFGFGWGYPYYGYSYPYYGWGYPYYGWGYPYYDWYYPWGYPYYYYPGSYWTGYYDGYYNGYYDGYYGYPYDPYTSYTYYGRRDMATSGGLSSNELNTRTSDQVKQDAVNRNERSVNSVKNERTSIVPLTNDLSGNPSSSNVTPAIKDSRTSVENNTKAVPAERSTSNRNPVQQEQYKYKRTSSQQSIAYQRNNDQISQHEKPTPRYTRPQNTPAASTRETSQSYSSPSYRQPKSSQEYINPRPQTQTSRSVSSPADNSNNRSYSNPSNTERRYSPPSNNTNNSRQYTSPSGNQNRNNTAPSKTNSSSGYSSPSRSFTPSNSSPSRSSSPSYSTPSRSSSPSYSAPSRSGGSSGGSGSSGGGGRRK